MKTKLTTVLNCYAMFPLHNPDNQALSQAIDLLYFLNTGNEEMKREDLWLITSCFGDLCNDYKLYLMDILLDHLTPKMLDHLDHIRYFANELLFNHNHTDYEIISPNDSMGYFQALRDSIELTGKTMWGFELLENREWESIEIEVDFQGGFDILERVKEKITEAGGNFEEEQRKMEELQDTIDFAIKAVSQGNLDEIMDQAVNEILAEGEPVSDLDDDLVNGLNSFLDTIDGLDLDDF